VDLLVWYKQNTLGMGSWLRSQAEFAFLLQNSLLITSYLKTEDSATFEPKTN